MTEQKELKPILWVGTSKKDLRAFPEDVKGSFGFDLYQLQLGLYPSSASPLKNVATGVFELSKSYDGETYRVVYIAKRPEGIYVLHSFQKKSKRGIATPQKDLDLILQRLKSI